MLQFSTSAQLSYYLASQGYVPGELAQKLIRNEEFPSVADQLALDWYPHNYFRLNGGYDGQSTHDATLFVYYGKNEEVAKTYCHHTIFMTSFREAVQHVFSLLEKVEGTIALPAGGVPYYVPITKRVLVTDIDEKLGPLIQGWPNCASILGPEGDIFKLEGSFNTICCMGFSFYLQKQDIRRFLQKFHDCLADEGQLILNFILALDEQGKDAEDKSPFSEASFKKAVDWNMDVIFGLNKEPKFNSCFLGRKELGSLSEGLFEIEQIYSGTLHVHSVAVLRKI
jgi:hypothetical protein